MVDDKLEDRYRTNPAFNRAVNLLAVILVQEPLSGDDMRAAVSVAEDKVTALREGVFRTASDDE